MMKIFILICRRHKEQKNVFTVYCNIPQVRNALPYALHDKAVQSLCPQDIAWRATGQHALTSVSRATRLHVLLVKKHYLNTCILISCCYGAGALYNIISIELRQAPTSSGKRPQTVANTSAQLMHHDKLGGRLRGVPWPTAHPSSSGKLQQFQRSGQQ